MPRLDLVRKMRKGDDISIDYLKECLQYNPDTGVFIRKIRPLHHFPDLRSMSVSNAVYGGKEAGSKSKRGYIIIYLEGRLFKAHRLAYFYMNGSWPEGHMDHINHIKSDNRWGNLRVVCPKENARNKPISKNNTNGFNGVCWDSASKMWSAEINSESRHIRIGRFQEIWDALCARKSAENVFGYHINHGSRAC